MPTRVLADYGSQFPYRSFPSCFIICLQGLHVGRRACQLCPLRTLGAFLQDNSVQCTLSHLVS